MPASAVKGLRLRIFKACIASCAMLLATRQAGAQIFGARPSPTPTPATIVARMGTPTTESDARRGIAFSPFTPPRRIVGIALIPPFHGEDSRSNRGIAFEYLDVAGRAYALAEWPRNGGSLNRFAPLASEVSDCPTGRSFPRGTEPSGIVWSTSYGLVLTLQADGANDARTLDSEWRKLIRRGACR